MGIRWSGIRAWYKVRFTDGSEHDVLVRVVDGLRWEANNGGRSLIADGSLTAMMTCVYYALRREKLCDETDFGAWAQRVEDFAQLDPSDGEVLPDPSKPDQSGG